MKSKLLFSMVTALMLALMTLCANALTPVSNRFSIINEPNRTSGWNLRYTSGFENTEQAELRYGFFSEPDEEYLEGNNPDREVIAKRKAALASEPFRPDFSSYINALLAKSDETIASLKRELAAKDDIIQAKDDRIADLEKLAEERLHRIAELRRVIDANNMKDFPFPMGTADAGDKDRMRV